MEPVLRRPNRTAGSAPARRGTAYIPQARTAAPRQPYRPQAAAVPPLFVPANDTRQNPQPRRRRRPLTMLAKAAGGLAGATGLALFCHSFLFQIYHINGSSMEPTLDPSAYVLVSKLAETKARVQQLLGQTATPHAARGEIIVLRYPKDPTQTFIKRVVGQPGDRVVIQADGVTVHTAAEPAGFNPDTSLQMQGISTPGNDDVKLGHDGVYVLGDNRAVGQSYDSREWGELPQSNISGHVIMTVWPLRQIKLL